MNCVRPTPDSFLGDVRDLEGIRNSDGQRKVEKPKAFKASLTSPWRNAVINKLKRTFRSHSEILKGSFIYFSLLPMHKAFATLRNIEKQFHIFFTIAHTLANPIV